MAKFVIDITETLCRKIIVEAENEAAAIEAVSDAYYDEKIILMSDDYTSTDIERDKEAEALYLGEEEDRLPTLEEYLEEGDNER